MKTEKIIVYAIKALVPLVIVILITNYFYPFELNKQENIDYLKSYGTTLLLTSSGLVIGLAGGFVLAFLLCLKNNILTALINEYLDFIRGIPIVLLLMIFAFYIFTEQGIINIDNALYVAIIAIGLNSTAYVTEIIRSGIESVDKGQMEAARAMGLSNLQAMKMIIFPQALKNIIPALANEFISLFKETSVVSFISVIDLTFQSKIFQGILYDPKPYIFAGVVYYASVKIFTICVRILEARLKKND